MIDILIEDFMWGIRPLTNWLSERSGFIAQLLRPLRVTEFHDDDPTILQVDTDDMNKLQGQMQRIIGRLQSENNMLKNEREIMLKKLYEDNVLSIGKELTGQLDSLAKAILTRGELVQYKQLPIAISSGRSHSVMGRLMAISRFNDRFYPVLFKENKVQVVTQGVGALEEVIRTLDSGEGMYPYAILSYDEDGKYVPKAYMMI